MAVLRYPTLPSGVVLAIAVVLTIAGCTWPFHGPLAPTETGTWRGKLTPVDVLDDAGEIHCVVQITLTSLPLGMATPTGHDITTRFNPTPEHPISALLITTSGELIPISHCRQLGSTATLTGTLSHRLSPVEPVSHRPAVRLSDAAVIVDSNGQTERVYSNNSQLTLRISAIQAPPSPSPTTANPSTP